MDFLPKVHAQSTEEPVFFQPNQTKNTIHATKPHTDENELICWHFDHSKNRSVKGLNLLNCIYQAGEVSVPVAYELVRKPIRFCDRQTRRVKRKSEVSKNRLCWPIVGFRPRKTCCLSAKT